MAGSGLTGASYREYVVCSNCHLAESLTHNPQYLQVMKHIFLPSILFCKDAIVTKIMILGWTLIYIYPLLPTIGGFRIP